MLFFLRNKSGDDIYHYIVIKPGYKLCFQNYGILESQSD